MATAYLPDLAGLYEADEAAWLDAMAGLARAGAADQLDLAHLAEFLESMANRERREVTKRLVILLVHLLKWSHQPEKRTRRWTLTILEQRRKLGELFESKTLRAHAAAALARVHEDAARRAVVEAELPRPVFPSDCPFTLDAALAGPLPVEVP